MRRCGVFAVAIGVVLGGQVWVNAATLRFDETNYAVAPGGQVTAHVLVDVAPGEQLALAAISAKVSISGGDVVGALTTSLADVAKASTGTYILIDSTGFAKNGTGALLAIGGDATSGDDEIKGPGTYSFMDILLSASLLGKGTYSLTFEDVGLGIGGGTYLSNAAGVDGLTGATGATVAVPEPSSVLLLLMAGLGFRLGRRAT